MLRRRAGEERYKDPPMLCLFQYPTLVIISVALAEWTPQLPNSLQTLNLIIPAPIGFFLALPVLPMLG